LLPLPSALCFKIYVKATPSKAAGSDD
jgi:hypothetical protein